MGDPAQRRFRRRFPALRRLHHRQSELAEHRHAAPQGRGRALPGAAVRRRSGHRAFSPATRRSPPRAGLRSPARCSRGRPRRRAGAGARGLAHDGFSQDVERRRVETFGDLLTRPTTRRAWIGGFYEKDDTEAGLRAAARLGGNELADRQGAHRDAEQGRQQGRARRGAGRGPQRHRLQVQPASRWLRRADKIAEAVRADARRRPRARQQLTISTNGGSSAACWPASCSIDGNLKDAYAVVNATRRRLTARTIAPSTVHGRLDRAALPARPGDRLRAFRQDRGGRRPIRSRSRAAPIGRAAPPKRSHTTRRRSSITRRPRAIRPPITARSPAPRLGSASSRCIRFPALSSADRNRAMSLEVVRAARAALRRRRARSRLRP